MEIEGEKDRLSNDHEPAMTARKVAYDAAAGARVETLTHRNPRPQNTRQRERERVLEGGDSGDDDRRTSRR